MKQISRFAGHLGRVVLGGAFGASLLLAARVPAAAIGTIFLDVPGIPGEATFPPVAGQIDVISYTTGVGPSKAAKGSSAYGGLGKCAAPPSKPVLAGFCVVKNVDKASPKLFLAAAQGTVFSTVTVSLYKITSSGETTMPYVVYTLSNAIVSSVQHGALSPSDIVPTETVCFNADKTQVSVAPVDSATGGVGTPVVAGFDACLGAPF